MKLLLASIILKISLGLVCPFWTCKSLDPNVCAIRKDREIIVNQDGCYDGFQCNLQVTGFFFSSVESLDSFTCYQRGEIDKSVLIYPSYYDWQNSPECKYDPKTNLDSGSHPKQCETDEDCKLINGEFTKCECSVNGRSYCKPSLNSDYFEYWFDICETGYADDKLYNKLYNDYRFTPLLKFADRDDQDCLKDEITQDKEKEVPVVTSSSTYLMVSAVVILIIII